jgi:hypothetical protein
MVVTPKSKFRLGNLKNDASKKHGANSPRIQNPDEGRTFQVLVSRQVCQQEPRRGWDFGPFWFRNSRAANVEAIQAIGGPTCVS